MRRFLAAIAATSLAASAPAQQESFLRLPDAATVLETLQSEHPRVVIDAGTFGRVRALVDRDAEAAAWNAEVLARAEQMLAQPVSLYELPDGVRLLRTSRRVLDRVMHLAYASKMTGDRRFVDRAWAELEAAAAFKDWNPAHFLDTAEMTCAFGLAYDWFYADWTSAQRGVLRDAIVRHGLRPGLARYRGESRDAWWTRTTNNWNQVCNGGLAVGALAVADEEPEVAAEVLASGLRSLPIAMRHFAPDGGCEEGPAYWHYAVAYNVRHIQALRTALGTDFGLREFPGFDRTGDVPMHMTAPGGDVFNYADGRARPISAPEMFWLGGVFDRPDWGAWQREHIGPASPLDLIYAADHAGALAESAAPPPLDRWFENIQVGTMRSAWDDPNAWFVGIKGGDNGASHGHLDLGSFVFDLHGQRWAVDIGSDDYNLPAYFGARRWTYFRLRAESHNTLLVDPGEGPDQAPRAVARVDRFASRPREARAVLDLSPAYPAAAGVRRGIALLDGRSRLLVQDEIVFSKEQEPAPVRWAVHTPAAVTIDADGRGAVLTLRGRTVRMRLIEPGDTRLGVVAAAPLPSSPNPPGQGANTGITRIEIWPEPGREVRIGVEFTADDGREPDPLVPLSMW